MRTIQPADIVAALAHCEPRALADALAASPDAAFHTLSDAVRVAAEHKATYPRADVIAEADALLYDVLRWPIDDTLPEGLSIDPDTFAQHRNMPLSEAQRIIGHLSATENYAVDYLLQSGVQPNYTLQQGQVLDCIVALRMQDRVPTRALVREHAMRAAQTAMRSGEGTAPLIYSSGNDLPPRIVSPSPKFTLCSGLTPWHPIPRPSGSSKIASRTCSRHLRRWAVPRRPPNRPSVRSR